MIKFYKVMNALEPLTQGETYTASKKGRHTLLTNERTGRAFMMYPWEITMGLAKGALVPVQGCASAGMDCKAGDACLAHTPNGFAY